MVKDALGTVTAVILDDSYTYDANGNVLSLLDASNAPATDKRSWGTPDPVANPTKVTQYDGLDRLLKVYNPNWGTPPTGVHNAVYTYDPLDNLRTNRLGAGLLTYGYNSSNQLATLTYGTGSAQSVTTNTRGDITANAYRGQAYQFDLSHRLSEVSGKESYLYDGNGRRARTLNLQTGTIEYFGYSLDGRLMQDWSNRRQVRNGYVYLGNTLVGLYEVNITNGAINPRYKHTDALGSPVVTTDASKNVMSRMAYTPYGAPTAPMDGVGYTGHFIDVGTQLTYMQQRYYDSQLGQFLSPDPLSSDPNTGGNFGRYRYGQSNPFRFVDPDGRASKSNTADWNTHLCDFWCESGTFSAGDDSASLAPRLPARGGGGNASGTSAPSVSDWNGTIDLEDFEGNGGHAIAQHVGKSDAFMARRMNTPFEAFGISWYRSIVSTFTSLESANRLTASVLSNNRDGIQAYLNTGSKLPMAFERKFSSPTGRAAFRPKWRLEPTSDGRPSAQIRFGPTYGVKVVILPASSQPGGFIVLTSYPTK